MVESLSLLETEIEALFVMISSGPGADVTGRYCKVNAIQTANVIAPQHHQAMRWRLLEVRCTIDL